jgi:hypothetical protein
VNDGLLFTISSQKDLSEIFSLARKSRKCGKAKKVLICFRPFSLGQYFSA